MTLFAHVFVLLKHTCLSLYFFVVFFLLNAHEDLRGVCN